MDARPLLAAFFTDVMTHGLLDRCDEIVAPEYVEHAVAPFGTTAPGPVSGPQHVRETAGWLREQFPDLEMQVEQVVQENDLVAVLVRTRGTNLGKLNGVIPPTGRSFDSRQSHWFRIEAGQLAEHWATREDLPAMLQLGVITRPGPPASR